VNRFLVDSDGTNISCADLGGAGRCAVLLHGLYGGLHEWYETAAWLKASHHVFAIDQRGHGQSAKRLKDFSLEAFARDACAVIEYLQYPVLLIGQSMGALNALLLAAQRPDLVESLVLIEAHAYNDSGQVQDWLSSWPLPFANLGAAQRYFENQEMNAAAWVQVLEQRDGAYWPQFNSEDMRAIAIELSYYDFRDECRRISAPTLVIAGSKSWLDRRGTKDMAALIPNSLYAEIAGASHDVHLDAPEAFRSTVAAWLSQF
jgi:pimeloyl-ACP methyl ester carboxylesterase